MESEGSERTVSLVDFDGSRRRRALILELVLLRRVPEDGIVDGRDGEVLSYSPAKSRGQLRRLEETGKPYLIQAGTRSIRSPVPGRVIESYGQTIQRLCRAAKRGGVRSLTLTLLL